MRIAYVHGAAIPSRAASTVQVMKMCEAFALKGHAVYLLTPQKNDIEKGIADVHGFYGVQSLAKLDRTVWPNVLGCAYISAAHMAVKARAYKPDVVYSRFVLAGYAAAVIGLPVIHEIHRPLSHLSRVERLVFERLVRHRNFRYAITISDALRHVCEAECLTLAGNIVVAHDAADTPDGSEHVLSDGPCKLQVGYVGSLYPGKGVDLIVELAAKCGFADFHVIGGSEQEVERLRKHVSAIPNLIVHGFMPHPQAKKRIDLFDVVLAPYGARVAVYGDSASDVSAYMSPLELFEYMAAGKAIVCSDHEVLKEIITDGVTALVCRRDAIDDWVRAMVRLDGDSSLRKAIGDAARRVFLQQHTWAARAAQVLNKLSG